jgi:hypothetical protein
LPAYTSTALYCGGLATLIRKYIESDCGLYMDNAGGGALGTKYLDRETLVNLEILEKSSNASYFYMFKDEFGTFSKINLSRPRLFDSTNKKWKVTQ